MRPSPLAAAALATTQTLAVLGAADAQTAAPTSEPATASPGGEEEQSGAEPPHAVPPAPDASAAPRPTAPLFTLGGYAEALYQWNFHNPSNGITNFRGFDNRHNTFTLSNVALDAAWDQEGLVGRLTLQVGHTPSTYYLSEPSAPGSSGANASDAALWKYLQQAYVGHRFGPGHRLAVTAGLFLSPIGPESMARSSGGAPLRARDRAFIKRLPERDSERRHLAARFAPQPSR